MNDNLDVQLVDGGGFSLGFVTGLNADGPPPSEGAGTLFGDVARACVDRGIQPVQEKVYGLSEHREAILAARRHAYRAAGLDPDALPLSFHQGKTAAPRKLTGVQVWGVVPADGSPVVTTVPQGRLWKGPDFRLLYVPANRGVEEGGGLAEGPAAQARRMFLNADKALEGQNFTFRHVARTWIYCQRILDWYDDLNAVRNAFFEERGVGADPGRSYPASTGIQGVTDREECSMDVLAVDGPGATREPVRKSRRQGSADDYGSAFSRAMSVQVGGLDVIFVSGTASIDPAGRSIYLDDGEGQVLETLRCIDDLLAPRGAGLEDVRLATLFAKTPGLIETYEKTARASGMPLMPVVPTVADVCRDELLVEVEAVAVKPL